MEEIADLQHQIQKPYFDQAYKQAVERLFQRDKAYRGTGEVQKLIEVDASNIATLLSLIEDKGFPHSQIVGHKTSQNAYIILLHYDRDAGNQVLKPILDQAYHDGYLGPKGIAWIVDRRRVGGPKKQAPYFYFLNKERYKDLSLERKRAVGYRRDSIGLRPLE